MVEERQFLEKAKIMAIFDREFNPPEINKEKCIGCGQCAKVCPALVLEVTEKKSKVIYDEVCTGCGHCWAVCPEEAIYHQNASTAIDLRPGASPAVPDDTLNLLFRERRSIRVFKDKPISNEILEKTLEAGRYAPTASNRQDVNFVVLPNSEKVSELRTLVERFMEKTFNSLKNPVIRMLFNLKYGNLVIDQMSGYSFAYDFLKSRKEIHTYFPLPFGQAVIIVHARSFDSMAQFNCAVALYNCSLMSHSLGLGSCFMGFVHFGANMDKGIKAWLGIPKDHETYGAMVIGYPDVKYRRLVDRRKPDVKWL